MAKNKVRRIVDDIKAGQIPEEIFTTSRGIEVTLRPIPPYMVQMAIASLTVPEVPTYEVSLVSGGVEVHTHDEKSIEQSSDEEKKRWEQYQIDLQKYNAEQSDLILDIILTEGVEVDLPDEDQFRKRMKMLRIPLSDDSEEALLQYKKIYVIGCQEDAETIMSQVLRLTNINPEELKKIEDSFRNRMESGAQEGNKKTFTKPEDLPG